MKAFDLAAARIELTGGGHGSRAKMARLLGMNYRTYQDKESGKRPVKAHEAHHVADLRRLARVDAALDKYAADLTGRRHGALAAHDCVEAVREAMGRE